MFDFALAISFVAANSFGGHVDGDRIKLAFAASQGTSYQIHLSADLKSKSGTLTLDGMENNQVTDLYDDGSFAIESDHTGMTGTLNGKKVELPDETSTTIYSKDGTVTDIKSGHVSASGWRVAELEQFVYPQKEVKKGESWTANLSADNEKGTVDATAKYTFVGMETLNGHDTVKVQVEFQEVGGFLPASSKGFVWIDPQTGLLIKSEENWKDVPVGSGAFTGKMTRERTD